MLISYLDQTDIIGKKQVAKTKILLWFIPIRTETILLYVVWVTLAQTHPLSATKVIFYCYAHSYSHVRLSTITIS